MLTPGIARAFKEGLARFGGMPGVKQSAIAPEGSGPNLSRPALFSTEAQTFIATPSLGEENFGPSAVVIACQTEQEMIDLAEALEGQLTTTLHFTDADAESVRRLLPVLERKCGRIIGNGWPTGVEVSPAMVHGGPFPSRDKPRRFNDLKRTVGGISQQMLTRTLKALERDGMITRTVYPSVPPSVEYALTELGHSLSKPVNELGRWVEDHVEIIETSRLKYDLRLKEA